jgi:hypothetical protein
MPKGVVLELASLAERHPDLDLPYPHAIMAVIRLSVNPSPRIPLPLEVLRRLVVVNHRPPGSRSALEFEQEIGWKGLGFNAAVQAFIANTYNDNEITEKAAVAVAGLLVHELAGVQMKQVLPIGAGGDFAAEILASGQPIQVECSGLLEDHLSAARARLRQKCEQVLTTSSHGYASVTTFHQLHRTGGIVHSFLHYVKLSKGRPAQPGAQPRRKRR